MQSRQRNSAAGKCASAPLGMEPPSGRPEAAAGPTAEEAVPGGAAIVCLPLGHALQQLGPQIDARHKWRATQHRELADAHACAQKIESFMQHIALVLAVQSAFLSKVGRLG